MSHDDIFQTAIDTIRTLPIDAVEQARSGHPGTPWPSRRSSTPSGTA